MRLYSAEAMRATDARALELGYPSLLLMEAAGRAVAEEARQRYPQARCAAVLVGPGNNGGDGMVTARWLLSMGLSVRVFATDGHRWDAAQAKAALIAHGVKLEALSGLELESCELVIDALFGTGLKRSLAGVYAEVVNKVNAAALPVVSVDLPSGLPYTPHVRAGCTVSLGGLKYEHLFYPYREACGRVRLVEIGLPAGALESAGLPVLSTPQEMRGLLPRRAGNAHKGSVGRVLVVGGFGTYHRHRAEEKFGRSVR